MTTTESFENVKKIIIKSREFSKCRKCECMKESLESIKMHFQIIKKIIH